MNRKFELKIADKAESEGLLLAALQRHLFEACLPGNGLHCLKLSGFATVGPIFTRPWSTTHALRVCIV